jgi:Uncharacterized protein conserved in bacteria
MKKQMGHAIARNILKLFLSAIAVFLSVWLIIGFESEPGIAYDADTAHTSIAAITAITSGEPNTDARVVSAVALEMAASLAKITANNEDAVGWLLIPNICYYPIMYSSVYDYYLTHNPHHDASARGSIFINYQCEPGFDNMLTLIHGHNMKDGTMFGRLSEYLGEDFFTNNISIMIYDGELIRIYKPFTAVILEENNDVIDARELSDAERTSYIESMYNRSICKMKEGEAPDLTKPIIFFSTCDYSFSEARLLVGAYLLGIEEAGG